MRFSSKLCNDNERRPVEKIPEVVVAVESMPDEETGLELNEENVEKANHYIQLFTAIPELDSQV